MSLKELSQKNNFYTVFNLIKVWSLIFSLLFLASRFQNPIVWFIVAFFNGVFIYHLNILGHDGIHGLLADSKNTNDFLSRFFVLGPQLTPLTAIKTNHLNHHRTLGTENDQDRQYYEDMLKSGKGMLVIKLAGSFFGGMVYPIALKLLKRQNNKVKTKASFEPADILSVMISQAFLFVVIWQMTSHWWAWIVLWVIPVFTVMTGLNTVRSCLEHADPGIRAQRNRTFISNPFERFFFSPLNMNFHAEHHKYPTIPYYNLPATRKWMLQEEPKSLVLESSYTSRLNHLLKENF